MRTSHAILHIAALLWILPVFAMMTSCAVISDEISQEALPQLPFDELVHSAGMHQGETVIVGGYILSVENQERQTQLVALQAPLGAGQQPKSKDLSKGRLILVHEGFIDPEVFAKDRQITVGGKIMGSSATEKHPHPYPYLRVQIEQIHLWREPDPMSSNQYWYDDCYAYPYGWRHYRGRPWCW